jgi:peptidoglycan-associated lipoprotein
MMRRISTPAELRLIAILLAAMLAFSAGCASKNTPTADSEAATDTEFSDGMDGDSEMAMEEDVVEVVEIDLPPIYFALDSTEIRGEFRGALEAGAMGLKESGASVVIEGHCDERGSEEYNFALGERRAGAVRKYLFNLGVPMGQMTVISYGEARPAVVGRGESAWSMNRRSEFKVR